MQGDKKALEHLNIILCNELTAINQYFLHAKMHKHWGFSKLATAVYKESIDEMKHADSLAERILFLNGLPNFQKIGKLLIGQNPYEALQCDLKLEQQAVADIKEAISYTESIQDFVSRNLLMQILVEEENHTDLLETQLDIINRIGLEKYLQTQI